MSGTATRFTVQLYAAVEGGPVNWRLLSGNNRECGRGEGSFPDAQQCVEFVRLLQAELPRVTRRNRRVDPHRWSWQIELDGRGVAIAGHTFDRQVRCEQGARHFLEGMSGAVLRPGVVVSGARRWGTVA